jgi:hypothetical protein
VRVARFFANKERRKINKAGGGASAECASVIWDVNRVNIVMYVSSELGLDAHRTAVTQSEDSKMVKRRSESLIPAGRVLDAVNAYMLWKKARFCNRLTCSSF